MHIIRLEISQREKKPRFARGAKNGVNPWRTADGEVEFWSGAVTDIVRRQPDGAWKIELDYPCGIG